MHYFRANQLWQTLPFQVKDCPSLQLLRTESTFGARIDINVKFYFQLYWCSLVKTLSYFSLVKCKSFVSALCSFLNEGVILKSKQSACHLGFCKLCKLCCKFCSSSLFCIRHWVNKYHQIVVIITKIFSNKVINLLPLELQRCLSR